MYVEHINVNDLHTYQSRLSHLQNSSSVLAYSPPHPIDPLVHVPCSVFRLPLPNRGGHAYCTKHTIHTLHIFWPLPCGGTCLAHNPDQHAANRAGLQLQVRVLYDMYVLILFVVALGSRATLGCAGPFSTMQKPDKGCCLSPPHTPTRPAP